MRVPEHIGIIPDGNRRWALSNNMTKDKGYEHGINPGLEVFKLCQKENIFFNVSVFIYDCCIFTGDCAGIFFCSAGSSVAYTVWLWREKG